MKRTFIKILQIFKNVVTLSKKPPHICVDSGSGICVTAWVSMSKTELLQCFKITSQMKREGFYLKMIFVNDMFIKL